MTNLLEPWVLLRLVAGLVAFALFARAAITAQRVLRYFDASRSTEGQLALEKQLELAATFTRVAAVVQVFALLFSVLAADRLSRNIRGAMCAYGVFSAQEWGFRSLAATSLVALVAGLVTQLYAFDARVRSMDLARPLAVAVCVMAPLAAFDLVASSKFFLGLDLSVVASCCSVQLDPIASTGAGFSSGPRVIVAVFAMIGVVASIGSALASAHKPTRRSVLVAGGLTMLTLPTALAASVLEVAPHVFEVPTHTCPFCLLRAEGFAIGYPLYASLFLATMWVGGVAVSGILARKAPARAALADFAVRRLRLGAMAWVSALALSLFPVVHFAVVAGGTSLFPSP